MNKREMQTTAVHGMGLLFGRFFRASARRLEVSRAFICGVFLVFLFASTTVLAQVPSQQQMELFKTLPPDQQQAILNSLSNSPANSASIPTATPPASIYSATPPGSLTPTSVKLLEEMRIPRIAGSATIILDVALKSDEVETSGAQATLRDRRARILAGNPFLLDKQGRLTLPFLPPIELAGLRVEEAAQRLNADPRLEGLHFKVTLLPLDPIGPSALKSFGYELFRDSSTSFSLTGDAPPPANYVVGPGDVFVIDTFGKMSGHYSLAVSREGRLQLPLVGPMQVAGLTFEEARNRIEKRINQESIGVEAAVTMGPLRSIQVFVVGHVSNPGAYAVSSVATITNALRASGGISEVGSLRNITLKRSDGSSAGRFDLYDLLLNGDSSGDRRLSAGDVIVVPPVTLTAGVSGQVLRPAIYELHEGATVAQLLLLAGGTRADADRKSARLERIDANRRRVVIDLDLTTDVGLASKIATGDLLVVPQILADRSEMVTLEGHVQRPGASAWREGLRLSNLVGSLDNLKFNADQRYVLIRREHWPERKVQLMSADLTRAFAAPGTEVDPLLQSRDRVIVFSLQRDRGAELADVLGEIKMQARDNSAIPTVFVNGRVRAPGEYPLERSMKVSDLVRAGGGLDDAAYSGKAELTRFEVINGDKRETEVLTLDLSRIVNGDATADSELKPYDVLTVQRTPEWYEHGVVILKGEVKFPGTYPLRKGETFHSIVERAGGLTKEAYPAGTVFVRREVKEQQQQQIDTLAARMQTDLSLLTLQTAQATTQQNQNTSTLSLGQSLLSQLRSAKASGRLVVNVEKMLAAPIGSELDLLLEDGDTISIPKLKQYVAVVGEVQNPAAHIWNRQLQRDEYIQLSGGFTRNVDKKRVYVVRADGSVETPKSSWGRGAIKMQPGDTIVAPLDAERMRPLPLWSSVTQIIYNLAISAAAVASF